ncbi:DUF3885 domain-containing protein [Kroppenstedtia sanguinis]|uniref:DUF3885 domain-containing protein n=1 Tax=Kroppenstedtia sanguinis TaxID=1380684 RepID=A0ABW4CF06_9BACL
MGIKPLIHHDIFFVNTSKNTIFHIYDDRGCDIIATSTESIRHSFDRYHGWILGYDLATIEKVFK